MPFRKKHQIADHIAFPVNITPCLLQNPPLASRATLHGCHAPWLQDFVTLQIQGTGDVRGFSAENPWMSSKAMIPK